MKDQTNRLYIIDTTSPFYVRKIKKVVNWSKVPYDILEKKGLIRRKDFRKICSNFEIYVKHVAEIGYTALSIDQLCYLVSFDIYSRKTKKKIERYRSYFSRLFPVAKKNGLKIFINTDVIFTNKRILFHTQGRFGEYIELLKQAVLSLFQNYPDVDGIIMRIGESDGVDVKGSFLSRIIVKTPRQANRLLKAILPVFEKYGKYLIFRTWTIGAYPIGDMMWNGETYDAVFGDVESEHLIISMKYGDTDFFRYVDLNPLIFHGPHKKILELQTRREYEGFGEYPSFVGWDYQRFYEGIKKLDTFMGISVWCQTGGWSRFRNITFFENTSYWNELNTTVTLKLFREGLSVKDAVASFHGNRNTELLMDFLKYSEDAIKKVLYDAEIANRALYLNSVRLPVLVHIFWDYVTVTEHIISFCNLFAENAPRSVTAAEEGLESVRKMKKIGKELGLPYDYDFHYDTFELFYYCRKLIYSEDKETVFAALQEKLGRYRKKHPGTYHFRVLIKSSKFTVLMRLIFKTFIRDGKPYRPVDRILFNRLTALLFRLIFRISHKHFPAFIDKQSMPLDALLS